MDILNFFCIGLYYNFFRPFKIIRVLKFFEMRLNFGLRWPEAIAHLTLAEGHLDVVLYHD